ncbi:DUF1285 domain-containing protein [Halioglobus maricola]|uniref:DUF1285 domain-containing protein n=1 Tax=Halioglobus maricola TaxID=2601894 RepID=A0A5P9NJX5_9GAMM|nr:DUF1285 domain-containing protein [Halioglobus maricola]QFU75889.1 DUF1285 domain-containing protein [Halioglobus maricola]
MSKPLDHLEQQLGSKRDFTSPPLERWHPPLSGDIDIYIRADGSWIHEGDPITRDSLVRMFASILRREDDGDYYLVTPVEKWRLRVELHPLIVTDVALRGGELSLTLNTGRELSAGKAHPLFLEARKDNVAAVELWHGLSALFSRNAWYRLVELADEDGVIHTDEYHFSLV